MYLYVEANVYVREQEAGVSLSTPLRFLILPHALLPLFALASVSVTDCHVCVHNAGVGSLPPHGCACKKRERQERQSAVGLRSHTCQERTERKVRKTPKKRG